MNTSLLIQLAVKRSGSVVRRMNEVTLHSARLVLGRGPSSTSVCNQASYR